MPEELTAGQESEALLERGAELSRIRAAIGRAADGAGEFLMVEGPAGIGKTSLLRSATAIASDRGFEVLSARAIELESEFPFGAVRQLLERRVRSLSDADREQVLAGAAAGARAVLGLDPDRPQGEPGAVYLGLYWTIANLAESAPLLVVLDDAQWADPDSLRSLAYLAPRLADLPVLLILAAREEEWEAADLFAATASDAGSTALAPKRLSAEASAELAAAAYGEGVAPEFAAACHRATQGNPFYLRSLLAELRRDAVAPSAEAASRVMGLGPRAVRQAIVARLARLDYDARAAVRAASVLEEGASRKLTADLAGIELSRMPAAAEALVRAEVLEEGEEIRFTHPIVRNAVNGDLGAADRERLHRRAAELLERDGAPPERIAPHLLALTPTGNPVVVEGLRRAAAEAAGHGAMASAVAHLLRALAEPPPPKQRRDVEADLGMAAMVVDGEIAAEHLRAALELTPEPEDRAPLARALVSSLLYLARNADAVAVLREELERATAAGSERIAAQLEAELVVALATSTGEDLDEADARLEHLVPERAAEPAEPLALAALAFRGLHRTRPAAESVETAVAALEGLERADPSVIPSVLVHAVGVMIRCDRLDPAAEWTDRASARAQAVGSLFGVAVTTWLLGCIARRRGDLDEAVARHQTALRQAHEFGSPEGISSSLAGLVDAQTERGEIDEADAELRTAGFARDLPGAGVGDPELLLSRARLRLVQGDLEAARADLALARARFTEDRGSPGPGLAPWRSTEAIALLRFGERDRALERSAEELELARALDAPGALAIALTAAGIAEGGERGERLLAEAVEALEGTPIRLEHAKALVELGAAIRRGGRRAEAREPLKRGLEIARECGAVPLVERAYEELRATGARPRKILYTGVDALTPSERRVAELAASGLSNREIAQELFLSMKTVEFHLGQCYRKLGIESRKQLGAALGDA